MTPPRLTGDHRSVCITASSISLNGLWKISHTVIALAEKAVIAFMVSRNMNVLILLLRLRNNDRERTEKDGSRA